MTISAKNAQDLTSPWTHWFLYGDSGSGKTTNASTFPRPLFIVPQNESSITTLRGRDIPYYEAIDISSPVVGGVGGMLSILSEIEQAYDAGPDEFPYDTLVIESISHYADLAIEEMTRGGDLQMDQQKWGRFGSHFRNLQTRLRRLDCNVIFTALAKSSDGASDDETGKRVKDVMGMPMIQGQTSIKLPSACDVIGYCEEYRINPKDTRYRIHFRKFKQFPARSRFKRIPPVIEDFAFSKVEPFLAPDETE